MTEQRRPATQRGNPGGDRLPVLRPRALLASLRLSPGADRAVREAIVQSASFVQGVRRAASPLSVIRIRATMKYELKQARKARKQETKAALREYRARHRAEVAADGRRDVSGGRVVDGELR